MYSHYARFKEIRAGRRARAAGTEAVPKMYELRYQAMALFNIPSTLQADRTVAPPFQYLAPPIATAG